MSVISNAEKWIWLAELMVNGGSKSDDLLSSFRSIDEIYRATRADLKRCGVSDIVAKKIEDKSLDKAKKIISDCLEKGIRIITPESEEYPERLKNIEGMPIVLYAKGEFLNADDEVAIAVVGTRDASIYGERAARKLGYEIAEIGGVVVSGLAKGIDSFALEGAISAGGKCIAVLGCGVDIYYPPENAHLADAIMQNGTIVSEYPPQTRPDRRNFPRRNRIISGLSLGTVVVEAPAKSGALYTARYALRQNRDVFAVPSGIFEDSAAGSNNLIKEGATPVSCGHDILWDYRFLFGKKLDFSGHSKKVIKEQKTEIKEKIKVEKKTEEKKKFTFPDGWESKFSEDERLIITAISESELPADEIAAKSGIPMQKILSYLTMLEIRSVVKRLPGNRFAIKEIK